MGKQAQDTPSVEVIWEPSPRQSAFIEAAPIFEVLFGGARGGGKTDGVLGEWLSHADQYGEHAVGLMLRRTYKQLGETMERSRQIYTPLGAKLVDDMWRFPNGARLRFAYLERDADAENYQGHSYTRVYVEEITNFPSEKPILKMMATLRSGAGVPCGFRATGNPGGVGHHWVKARYINQAPLGWKVTRHPFTNPRTGKTIVKDRVFIPSKVEDNPHLSDDYVANLQMQGSAQLVRAWLEGDWSVIEGAFFPEWGNEKHVISPFVIPNDWLRFRSMDWGSASPFSVGWWAVASDDYQLSNSGAGLREANNNGSHSSIIPRGSLIRYREWYGASSPNVGLKMPAEEVGIHIKAKEKDDAQITYGVLDPAAFASDGGPSIAERMARSGVRFRQADNKRVAVRGAMGGWDQVRSRLIGNDGKPTIYFFSTCVDSIRTLPALQHDADKPEDVDTHQEDHACFTRGTSVDGCDISEIGVLTKRDTPIVCVRLSNGAQIFCTPNHKFMGASGQWVAAKDLSQIQLLSAQQFKSLKASGIIAAALTFSARAVDCIAWCGNTTRALFQRASTFITWTVTLPITPLRIWPYYWPSIISHGTGSKTPRLSVTQPERPLLTGMVQRKANNGTLAISSNTLDRYRRSGSLRLARIAGWLSRLALSIKIARNTAATTVNPVHCVSVEPAGRDDVYCIAKREGYFELDVDVVVSNCDEIRYACMSRPFVRQIEKKPTDKILGIGTHNQVTWNELIESQPTASRGTGRI